MPLTVELVRCGRPGAEALRATVVKAKAADPLSQVTVVVPSNHVGVATRRLLASGQLGPTSSSGSGVAAVGFVTVYRLAELLGAAELAAQGRRPISTPVIAAGLRAALRTDPGIFAPVADHSATETALVAAYRELRDVSAGGLDRLAAASRRAADVVRLHHAARVRLVPSFSDEEDLIGSAVKVVAAGGAPVNELGAVVVYLPEKLTRHGAGLLAALARHTDVHVVAGTTGDARADADVLESIRRIGSDVCPASGSVAEPREPMTVVSPDRTRIVTASDADEEVRFTVRAVIEAVRRGTPLERIGIVYAAHDPYARLVHEQLSAAGIEHNGAAVVPLTARLAGRMLVGLLALPQANFRRADLFAWLAGGPVWHEGHPVPVAAWERLSRDAGVVAGRDHWDRFLAAYAQDFDAEAERAHLDPDAPEWRAERLHRDAERCRALRRFVLGLIEDAAAAAAGPRRWPEHAAWARSHLENLLGNERRRSRWPRVEQMAAQRTENAIDRLAGLGAVEGPVSLEVFVRTLTLELESDLGRVGRMGEGVLVGTVRMGVGLDLDLLVVLGLAEGSFPAPLREDSLLPDGEREAATGELRLRADDIEAQHYVLLAALAGSTRQVLCVPRGDLRRSDERVPSRWVIEIASALAGRGVTGEELLGTTAPWLEHVDSFYAGLRRAAFPATEQEHRLRALLAERRPSATRGPVAGAGADAILAAGVEMVLARRSSRLTRFDGNLSGLAVPSPATAVTSATRLESWAACPFSYFVRQILRVEPVENPEDRLQLSPLDRGSLVHEVLERFIGEVLARPLSEQPLPQEAWSEADRRRLLEIACDVCGRYEGRGLVGRSVFWRRDRRGILADLERFLRADSDHRAANGLRPVAAELAFGMQDGGLETAALALPDGRRVRFRGKADRLDLGLDGTLEVVDYKTGSATNYSGLSEADPDLGGTKLQLPVYALAARLHQGVPDAPVNSLYWFTSAKGGFRRIGYPVTPPVLDRVSADVGQIVEGIEAGLFPHNPSAGSTTPFIECPYCDPDGLGVSDLRRQTERKIADPAFALFLSLTGASTAATEAG